MSESKIQIGSYVKSLAGRDSGRIHCVTSVDDDFVYIADGNCRRTQKPKRKKIKHVKLLDVPCYTGEYTDKCVCNSIKEIECNHADEFLTK